MAERWSSYEFVGKDLKADLKPRSLTPHARAACEHDRTVILGASKGLRAWACIYIYIYSYIHTQMYMYTYVHIYIYVCVQYFIICLSIYIYIYRYVCMHVCM